MADGKPCQEADCFHDDDPAKYADLAQRSSLSHAWYDLLGTHGRDCGYGQGYEGLAPLG